MKSVMISIKPKWCEMIARGQKTIEARKTRPKLETPFKCYIYCTKPKYEHEDFIRIDCQKIQFYGGQKVIGEFVCDEILQFNHDDYNSPAYDISDDDLNRTCLFQEDLYRYANGKTLYGWHISALVIYDVPRELENFWKAGKCQYVTNNGLGNDDFIYCSHCGARMDGERKDEE